MRPAFLQRHSGSAGGQPAGFLGAGNEAAGRFPITMTEQLPAGWVRPSRHWPNFSDDSTFEKTLALPWNRTGWPSPPPNGTDDQFQVVVAGMETHLACCKPFWTYLASGYQTFVVVDSVAAEVRLTTVSLLSA